MATKKDKSRAEETFGGATAEDGRDGSNGGGDASIIIPPDAPLPASGMSPTVSERTGTNGEKKKVVKGKRERFVDLAPARVNKALKAIAAVARCADVRGYEYTADEAGKITDAIDSAAEEVLKAFSGERKTKAAFSL